MKQTQRNTNPCDIRVNLPGDKKKRCLMPQGTKTPAHTENRITITALIFIPAYERDGDLSHFGPSYNTFMLRTHLAQEPIGTT